MSNTSEDLDALREWLHCLEEEYIPENMAQVTAVRRKLSESVPSELQIRQQDITSEVDQTGERTDVKSFVITEGLRTLHCLDTLINDWKSKAKNLESIGTLFPAVYVAHKRFVKVIEDVESDASTYVPSLNSVEHALFQLGLDMKSSTYTPEDQKTIQNDLTKLELQSRLWCAGAFVADICSICCRKVKTQHLTEISDTLSPNTVDTLWAFARIFEFRTVECAYESVAYPEALQSRHYAAMAEILTAATNRMWTVDGVQQSWTDGLDEVGKKVEASLRSPDNRICPCSNPRLPHSFSHIERLQLKIRCRQDMTSKYIQANAETEDELFDFLLILRELLIQAYEWKVLLESNQTGDLTNLIETASDRLKEMQNIVSNYDCNMMFESLPPLTSPLEALTHFQLIRQELQLADFESKTREKLTSYTSLCAEAFISYVSRKNHTDPKSALTDTEIAIIGALWLTFDLNHPEAAHDLIFYREHLDSEYFAAMVETLTYSTGQFWTVEEVQQIWEDLLAKIGDM